jgi:hypothetical protein
MKYKLSVTSLAVASAGAGLVLCGSSLWAKNFPQAGVSSANPRIDLVSEPNVIAPGFALTKIAQGSDPLENPSGLITRFGYLNDQPPRPIEPTKTEADENTYLVLDHNPGGPTPGYDYGRRFLFQGHENSGDLAYLTRINLDVSDPAHRITLLTPVGADGKTHFNSIDGSTWNPFTRTLLFTQEAGTNGGVIEVTPEWPFAVRTLRGVLGRGGFEGIHADGNGNLLIIEDAGGTSVNVDPSNTNSAKVAKNPNSFVYRFLPNEIGDLSAGGKLQALQVWISGRPVQFVNVDSNNPSGDVFSENQLKLHTLGSSWPVQWVTVHDTAVDGTNSFDANALAKAAGATPFKRPENAQFLPGSHFRTFFFDPTGDTDSRSGGQPALAARGAWGSIFRVDLDSTYDAGRISILFRGDADHAAFDNLTFASGNLLLAAEDRGDSLHRQLNKLDSIWAFNVVKPGATPIRFLALGRDDASTFDAHQLDNSTPGFQNEGDNEPTGLHVSDGDDSIAGLIGGGEPDGARLFFTQQHGFNTVFEVVRDHGQSSADDLENE